MSRSGASEQAVIAATRSWLERSVIGLNLCPFARQPYREQRVRIVVSSAADTDRLLQELADELAHLRGCEARECETTLLVHPQVLSDFLDYNDFLDAADALLDALELDGVLQIASFHPDYQFADSEPNDVANCTNRAPFPTLHLLREDSVEQAVASLKDPDAVYLRNIETLRQLGWDGWRKLMEGATESDSQPPAGKSNSGPKVG